MLKKLFFCSLLLLIALFAQSQNIPNTVTAPAGATAKKLPAPYSITPATNYLRVFSPQVPIMDTSLINMSSAVEDVIAATSYHDSYGRNVETITKQISAGKKDNVLIGWHDEFGRPSRGYLPYSASTNDGSFKTNPFYQDSIFYKTQFPNEQINYTQTLYDGSPLNIPVKMMTQGNSWGGAGVGISLDHRVNKVGDSVVLWTIDINTEDDVPLKSAFYLAGTLRVTEATNENGIKQLEYTNSKGQIVLSKKQLSVTPGSAHVGWLCTYYVYDEMSKLRMVIPPKAVESINNTTNNWSLTVTPAINANLCFAYFYDNEGRCIMKRIPGKGKSYFAYDLYNRVVMSSDPRLTALGQWTFVLYDAQSRPWRSGVITTALSKDSIIAQASRSLAYPTLTGTYTITSESYFDNYTWISSSGASFGSSLDATNINGTNFFTSYNSSPSYAQQITAGGRIRGATTGTKRLILNSSTYLFSVNLYDNHGRIIQTKQTNYSGGTDIATAQYSYNGRILRSHLAHQKSGTNAQTHTLLTKYTYDHVGRIMELIKNFDGIGERTIVQNNYSELGMVERKDIGDGLEVQNYNYNIRGWLVGINKDHVNNSSPSAYFGETIAYDYGFSNAQLNGNKAGIKWRSAGDSNVRAYGYAYDNANRLLSADFSQQNSGSTSWTKDKMDFSVSNLTFDANGNIQTMSQRGIQIGSIALIDSLNYQYFSNSNLLQKVTELATTGGNMGDFKDSSSAGDDYTYDANGNITRDNNRRMHTTSNAPGAVFNILDKADSIVIQGKATTYYYYDASGGMLAKKVNTYTSSGLVVKNYQYLSGFTYLNDTLQNTMIEGGRIRRAYKKNSTTGAMYYAYEYDYFISDHMGNVRTVVTEGRDTSVYKATMEPANSNIEDSLFANEYTPVNTVSTKPSGFDGDGGNTKVSKLNASLADNKKMGPSLVLKVMAGDTVQINSFAFYNTPTIAPDPGVNLLTELLGILSGGVVNNSGGKLNPGNNSAVSSVLSPNVASFLNGGRAYDITKPKAYLNWILFDNQFNFVATNSGVVQVQPGSSKQALVAPLQTMAKNGYLYVYVSNESAQDVYFDDITITHKTGPLIQEQVYYPFGLEIQGLSDKALMKSPNNYKYNAGSELEDDDGIGYYNTFFRKYDAQIGRFTGIDILAEENYSSNPFNFADNNPALYNDPSGAKTERSTINPAQFRTAAALLDYILNNGINSFDDDWTMWTFGGGGGGGITGLFQGSNFHFGSDGNLHFEYSYISYGGSPISTWTDKTFGDVLTSEGSTLNTLVVGLSSISAQDLWDRALSWGEENRDAYDNDWLGRPQRYDVMWQHNYDEYLSRRENGRPLVRSSDRASYKERLGVFDRYYQAEQDSRTMQLGAIAIMASPLLLEAVPFLTSAASTAVTTAANAINAANASIVFVETESWYFINAAKNFVVNSLGNAAIGYTTGSVSTLYLSTNVIPDLIKTGYTYNVTGGNVYSILWWGLEKAHTVPEGMDKP